MKVLVLCTGNSCRSQMMEGFLRHFAAGQAEIVSAGVEAHGLHPLAVQVMKEAGIDISGHVSDVVANYVNSGVTHVLTVCDHAAQRCPVFPGEVQMTHQSFPDPASAVGTNDEVIQQFRMVREMIRGYARAWVEEQLTHVERGAE